MQKPFRVPGWVVTILSWTARLGSMASFFLIVLFFIGEGFTFTHVPLIDWFGYLFFPFGILAGQLVGWRDELLGGTITAISLLAFYFVYGLLLNGVWPVGPAFVVFSSPGLLFLINGFLKERAS